jgi:hypothetical protein
MPLQESSVMSADVIEATTEETTTAPDELRRPEA